MPATHAPPRTRRVQLLTLLVDWIATATAGGSTAPFLVADIRPYGGDGKVQRVYEIGGKLFFSGDKGNGVNGRDNVEVYSYHPNEGVRAVTDSLDTATTSEALYMCDFDGKTYFSAFFDGKGVELAFFASPTSGAQFGTDVFAGATGSSPAFLTAFNGGMYFSAEADAGQGRELHVLSASVTTNVHNFSTEAGEGGDPKYLTVFNSKLYMQADSHGLNKGVELFVYDGNTVELAADINSNGADSSNPSHMYVFNSQLYMSADKGDGIGQELYVYDGTNEPTLVADINPGADGSFPEWLTEFNSTLHFTAVRPDTGRELFRLDGTTAVLVADTVPGTGSGTFGLMATLDGKLFVPYYTKALGWELHRLSDSGTALQLVVDLDNEIVGSAPHDLAIHDGELYFAANDGVHGDELWKYNSTHGAALVADLTAGRYSTFFRGIGSFNGSLALGASYGTVGVELTQFDPATSTFSLLADIRAGSEGSRPAYLCPLGDVLYFVATPSSGRDVLYEFSHAAGARQVDDFSSGNSGNYARFVRALNGSVYFRAQSSSVGAELYKYTPGVGSSVVKNFLPGSWSTDPTYLVAVGDDLYFLGYASTNTYDRTLMKYSPATDTMQVVPTSGVSKFLLLFPFQGTVALAVVGSGGTDQLLVMEPDESLRDGAPELGVPLDKVVFELVELDGRVYFASSQVDPTAGTELVAVVLTSPTSSPSPSQSVSATVTPSPTPTASSTPTPSPTPSSSSTSTPTSSASSTSTRSASPTPSASPTSSSSSTTTATPSSTASPTSSPSSTATPTSTPSSTVTPTSSPSPTASQSHSASPSPTPSRGAGPAGNSGTSDANGAPASGAEVSPVVVVVAVAGGALLVGGTFWLMNRQTSVGRRSRGPVARASARAGAAVQQPASHTGGAAAPGPAALRSEAAAATSGAAV